MVRITVPADVYNSGILVEIEGIELQARFQPKDGEKDAKATPGLRAENGEPSKGGVNPNRPRNNQPQVHDPGGLFDKAPKHEIGDATKGSGYLPTTADIAQSFLMTESPREREELKAALSDSPSLHSSKTSDSNEDSGQGVGAGFSLPGFVAGFLQGVGDRLHVQIKKLRIDVNFGLDVPFEGSQAGSSSGKAEPITFRMTVGVVEIAGITTLSHDIVQSEAKGSPAQHLAQSRSSSYRRIALHNVQGMFVSAPSLFLQLSQFSETSSPIATMKSERSSDAGKRPGKTPSSGSADMSPSEIGLDMTQSTVFHRTDSEEENTPQVRAAHDVTYEQHTNDPTSYEGIEMESEEDLNNSTFGSSLATSQYQDLYSEREEFPSKRAVDMTVENMEDSDTLPTFSRLQSRAPLFSEVLDQKQTMGSRSFQPSLSKSYRRPQAFASNTPGAFDIEIDDGRQHSALMETADDESPEQEFFFSGNQSNPPDSMAREDLSESRIFSHEEAESMYASAISQTTDPNDALPTIPGGWNDSVLHSGPNSEEHIGVTKSSTGGPYAPNREQLTATVQNRNPDQEGLLTNYQDAADMPVPPSVDILQEQSRSQKSPDESQRKQANLRARYGDRLAARPSSIIKRFMTVDFISVDLPHNIGSSETLATTSLVDQGRSENSSTSGAFDTSPSSKTEPQSLKHAGGSIHDPVLHHQSFHGSSSRGESDTRDQIGVVLHEVSLCLDMGLIRLAYMTLHQLVIHQSPGPKSFESNQEFAALPTLIKLHVNLVSLKFLDVIKATLDERGSTDDLSAESESQHESAQSETLLATTIKDIDVIHRKLNTSSNTDFSIGKFNFGYAEDNIFSFDSRLRMRESIRDILAPRDKDLSVKISQTRSSFEADITTLPIHIKLDLAKLDETFSWFGGLSSVLGLGNSMISNATIVDHRHRIPPTRGRRRGVHFESSSNTLQKTTENSQQKVTVRVGGLFFELQGRDYSTQLESTAMKLVSRSEGIGLQVDKLNFSGPYTRGDVVEPSVTSKILNVRVEYLTNPKEVDLARLLALLSPSRNKYEQEDDILLDTLLRQRRQGGVIRITVEKLESSLLDLSDLEKLSVISEELSKLSTVTRYLPEDDRPGVLTLGLVRDLHMNVHVNEKFGNTQIHARNTEIAHITLPSLVSLGLRTISIYRKGSEELVGEALPLNSELNEPSPTIMARFIGDELEPTIKIKLWNLRLEYHVETIMAILELEDDTTGQKIVTELMASVATLTGRQSLPRSTPKLSSQGSSNSEGSSMTSKLLRLDVSVQDSLIGLNPRKLPSRVVLVLTSLRISGNLPNKYEKNVNGLVDIKKATIMIVDDIKNITLQGDNPKQDATSKATDQLHRLTDRGYVSISSISAAKISLHMILQSDQIPGSIDIEVRDDLFVLESCADSTQTLLNTLNGLAPPMPPSQEIKYRTEVIPVEDMLASFTGEPYTTVDSAGEAEEDAFALSLDEGDMVDDEVPQNLEFVSSFYNPDAALTEEGMADSMLDDDLDSLTKPPVTRELGEKRLLQSFQERYEVAPGGEALQFQEDHFGIDPATQAGLHKWSSDRNAYDLNNEVKISGSPLRVHVRDVHVIWNLFDGYDWQHTRDTICQAVADVETKAMERLARKDKRKSFDADDDEESVIGDFLFNSIYVGIPANRDPRDLSRQVNRNLDDLASEADSYATSTTVSGSPSRPGFMPRAKRRKLRLNRSKQHKMTFELKGLSADVVIFPPNSGEIQSSVNVRVQDLDIFDHVPTSTWKKFATYMQDAGERESGTSMIHIEVLNVKPVPDLAACEIILKATVLPLRLHVDQDALDFMTRFFEFKNDSNSTETPSKSDTPFLQRVEINSIQVKLDFKPKRVDYAGLRSGHTNEFMNFFILDQADMVLRHVIIYGVSGFDKLGKTLNDIWMPDIKRNQLPGILAGLAPVRSLVNVGTGVRDLVVIPIREYRKDGRVVRSIQKGALAFAKTTTSELVKLGAKLAIGTQTILQGAETLLGSGSATQQQRPSSASSGNPASDWDAIDPDSEKNTISPYANAPIGVVAGLRGGFSSLERDLMTARDAIIAMPGEMMETGTAGGVARAVARHAPTIVLRPALGVSKAVGQTLLGAGNTLDREERRRAEDVSLLVVLCDWHWG